MKNYIKRTAVGLTAVVAVGGIGYGYVSSEIENQTHLTEQVDDALSQDGFEVGDGQIRNDQVNGESGIFIGKIILGNCEFDGVRANIHPSPNKGMITDIDNYEVAVGQIGHGKFQNDSIILRFDNAEELQNGLPDLNCDPL